MLQHLLVFDLLREFVQSFSTLDVELILLILQSE